MLSLYPIAGAPISGLTTTTTVVIPFSGVFGIPIKLTTKTNSLNLCQTTNAIKMSNSNRAINITNATNRIILRGIAHEIFIEN